MRFWPRKSSTVIADDPALHARSPPPADKPVLPDYNGDFPITTNRASASAAAGTGGVTIGDHSAGTPRQIDSLDMKALVIEDYYTIKHFLKHMEWRVVLRKMVQRYLWKWYLILAVAIVLTVLVTTQKDAVVHFCAPITHTIRSWPGGWLIPIVLLIIVSYPPLVGHEIIGILIGLVWGVGEGFAILAAGTFIGEILLWFSFKWCCTNAAAKFEKKNKLYWSLTQLIREKTFTFVLILRFSAIPGHIVTAVSASARANYWSYLAAAFLTLPKQLTIVYLGEAFGTKNRTHQIISWVTLIVTIVVTGIAAIYVYYQMRLVMKRHELELPTVDVPMVENPTWADVVAAEEAKEKASAGTSFDSVDVKDVDRKSMDEEKAYVSELTRDGGSRAWSVPHHMSPSEMKKFLAERESAAPLPASIQTTSPKSEIKTDTSPTFSSGFGLPSPTTANQSTRIVEEIAPDASPTAASTSSRGQSLDLPRPPKSARRTMGGREIADEADRLAESRGERSADSSRTRGESRAALLGKPKGGEV